MNIEGIGIYQIISPRGSRYVGMTLDSFENRWLGHVKLFKSQGSHCAGLTRAFAKYGVDAMRFEILEEVPRPVQEEVVLQKERDWWLHLKDSGVNLYNGEPTGPGSVFHTSDTRERIGNSVRRNAFQEKVCESYTCSATFITDRQRQVYCSRRCAIEANRKSAASNETLRLMHVEWGMSLNEMAEILGVTAQSVSKRLRLQGVTINRRFGNQFSRN